jgi:membrane protein DedA with SNARE-associated domain
MAARAKLLLAVGASMVVGNAWGYAPGLGSLSARVALVPSRRAAQPAMLALPALPTLTQLHAMSSSIQPWHYFSYLMAAGAGVPLSEDGLALLAGSLLPSFEKRRQLATVLALYLGVVLSDIETFLIGAVILTRLGRGLSAVRRGGGAGEQTGSAADGAGGQEGPGRKLPVGGKTRLKVLKLISESGQYIGFVSRFCVGLRAPIALTCGVLPGISLARFSAGSALGALCTVPLQLWLGHVLRSRVTSPVGLASLCASFYAAGPFTFAAASAVLYVLRGRGQRGGEGAAGE